MAQSAKRRDILKEAGEFFTQPAEELDKKVRKLLDVPETGPYTRVNKFIFMITLHYSFNDLKYSYYSMRPAMLPTTL